MRLPLRRLLALAAAGCLASSAAAQVPAPAADLRTPTGRFLILAPLAAFPDPVAVSLAVNAGAAGGWARRAARRPRIRTRGHRELIS